MTERKPAGKSWDSWREELIQRAREEGAWIVHAFMVGGLEEVRALFFWCCLGLANGHHRPKSVMLTALGLGYFSSIFRYSPITPPP